MQITNVCLSVCLPVCPSVRLSVCVFQRGETALHMAARAGQADVVRYLLQNGANVETKAKVSRGQGALHTHLRCLTGLRTDVVSLFCTL